MCSLLYYHHHLPLLSPYTTLFRSYYSQNREWIMPSDIINRVKEIQQARLNAFHTHPLQLREDDELDNERNILPGYSQKDRKSTRLNSSHVAISYAVFCLKKKKTPH